LYGLPGAASNPIARPWTARDPESATHAPRSRAHASSWYSRRVRIVAGEYGGRVLRAPSGLDTRPTTEKVREAIFSILGPPDPDAAVLDLFAGSGAMGLEALSRGAAHATFVEKGRPALSVLRRNLADLDAGPRAVVHAVDAIAFLARNAGPWRWIFIDPPYRSDLARRALDALGAGAALTEDGSIVVEHDRRNPPADAHGSLLRTGHRRYGDTELSFYRHRSEPRP
jgi:16S rRNA (guanine966-N2)-methyltransferase